MANLIIKSSADNLVLQGSDASPAITVGATGTTTFAENLTLSGTANNLGTTTAGTLTSGVTFPTGHVLQTLYDVDATTQTLATSTYTATDLSIAVTPSSTSNKILCIWTMVAEVGANEGYGTTLVRDSTDVYISGQVYHVYDGGASRAWGTFIHLDSPSSTSALTYKVQIGSYAGNSITLNSDNVQSHFLLQEIAG